MDTAATPLLAAAAAVLAVIVPSMAYGAGYQPTPKHIVEELLSMREFRHMRKGSVVYDVGAGMGRVTLTILEKTGYNVVAVEPEPLKYFYLKLRTRKYGERVRFARKSCLKISYADADAVYCFLTPWLNAKLKPVIEKTAKPGAAVVSYLHQFNGWMRFYCSPTGLRGYYPLQAPTPKPAAETATPPIIKPSQVEADPHGG